jgi:putative salt-induced outer membrane protein
MRTWLGAASAVALAVAAGAAHAEPLPRAVADILDAAADEPDSLRAVVRAAKKANPGAAADIDAYAAALVSRTEKAKAEQVAGQAFLEGWTGKVDLGGSISTGNTVEKGFTGSLGLARKSPAWEHDLDLAVTFKTEDQKTTTDRYFATYSILRNLAPRFYVEGLLWAERDRFAGYNYRFSEGVGIGYRLIARPTLKVRIEGGPALRQSEYLDRGYEATGAIRLAGYLTWRIAPRLEFSQRVVSYLDTKNSTVLATSTVTTPLQGTLSAKASYEVRLEDNPPEGRARTDTTTRATLALSF